MRLAETLRVLVIHEPYAGNTSGHGFELEWRFGIQQKLRLHEHPSVHTLKELLKSVYARLVSNNVTASLRCQSLHVLFQRQQVLHEVHQFRALRRQALSQAGPQRDGLLKWRRVALKW